MLTKLRMQRLKAGLRQVDLAERTKLPQHRISLIERGVIPLNDEARALAGVLELSVDELFPNRRDGS